MPRRLVASLLFCVALFVQLAAPLARGVATSQSAPNGPGFVALCKLLHGEDRGDHGAPSGSGLHDHSCSLCQTGVNVAPLLPEQIFKARRAAIPTRVVVVKTRDRVASRLFLRGPPARAPPALVEAPASA